MSQKLTGELEIDSERGVIYFHLTNSSEIRKFKAVTMLRISGLPKLDGPIHHPVDLTHMRDSISGWGELSE